MGVNMVDVARALKTNPAYITKYMGGELGALSTYTHAEDKSIVNGAHETSTAQQLVDKFIAKFVLCPNCKLPEIDMMVKKGFLAAGCKACGWQGDLDNTHKLVKFIIQNPPGSEAAGFTIANKKETKKASQTKKKKKDDDSDDDDDDDEDDEDGDKKDKKKDKKDKKEKKEKKEKKKKEKGDDDDDDDDDDEAKDKKKKKEKKEKKEKEGKEKKEKKKDKGDEDTAKAKKGSDDGEDDLEFTDELIVESTKRLAKFVKEQETK